MIEDRSTITENPRTRASALSIYREPRPRAIGGGSKGSARLPRPRPTILLRGGGHFFLLTCARPPSHTGAATNQRPAPGTRWWDFIGYRRRYVSDRVWFGAAFIAASVGNLGGTPGWWKVLDLAGLVAGMALASSGVRRWLRREGSTDSSSPERR
jgi:hypothetical protein